MSVLIFHIFISDYPELPNVPEWTRNTPEYCNSCTPNCPNTNVLDCEYCNNSERNTPEYCNTCTPNCPNTNILDFEYRNNSERNTPKVL